MVKLEKIYNTFCLPALIVHELLHFIAIKLTRSYYTGVAVDFDENFEKNGRLSVSVYFCPDNKFQNITVLMAPFIGLFIWLIPLFLGLETLSIISLLYTLICIKYVMPSRHDFEEANFIKNKKSSQS